MRLKQVFNTKNTDLKTYVNAAETVKWCSTLADPNTTIYLHQIYETTYCFSNLKSTYQNNLTKHYQNQSQSTKIHQLLSIT